jgi:hypothetical protein
MRFDPRANVTQSTPRSDGRRRAGRLGQESVVCDRGVVLDLSSGGMRIRCSRVPKQPFETRIQGLGMQVKVRVQVAWFRRIGLFKHEVGLRFFDIDDHTRSQLTQLAMACRMRRAI